jgi:AcrR family transcriptional regulator
MLAHARRLFWKKGFNGASMGDIARAYGCRTSNIYNFFRSKEEILYQVLYEELHEILEPIRHLDMDEAAPPDEQLRLIIKSHVELALSHQRTSKLLFDVGLNHLSPPRRKEIMELRDTYDSTVRRVIRRGIDCGLFREIDEKLAGFMIASMVTRTRVWYHPGKGLSVRELVDFIYDFAVQGLAAGRRVGKNAVG